MPFQKGNKYGTGRPKGSKDKLNGLMKERIIRLLDMRFSELTTMEIKELFKGVISLMPKEQKLDLGDSSLNINITRHTNNNSDTSSKHLGYAE